MSITPEESIRRVREDADWDKLADNFQYCYNHLEEWENGEIEPSDLPHFDDLTNAIIMRSIAFGCSWEEHVPSSSKSKTDFDDKSTTEDDTE